MKKILFSLLLCVPFLCANAQGVFVGNDQAVNVTLGVGRGVPLQASYEMCIMDNLFGDEHCSLGVGAYLGWTHYTERYAGIRHHNNSYRFGVQSTIHYNFVKNLDTYAGLMLGYKGRRESWKGYSLLHSSSSFYFVVGARYYFDKNWAVVGEFGAAHAFFRAGIAYKF